ncbi:cytochrome c biogenesis heme-transporting ATPase CcmA [Reinekea sp.]|jgi:heme exporter protein A|uniref:cytochrome c biogenesis heme-transporting ATPase CcmA n=1 Tax=Reinekea sp. TaxID=1970455 RepID=UPI003989AFF0
MGQLLSAKHLFCERDDRILFQNLEFVVNEGDILHIKGPNGSGKTTLLRRLVGLSGVVEGELVWQTELSQPSGKLSTDLCWYLAHRPAVTMLQTPLENLTFSLALHNALPKQEELWQALETVGLRGYEDVPASSLSAGQQRRVALSKLYIAMPNIKLWVLDEPFTALDVSAVSQLEARIEQFAEAGGTVIMTSHHGLNHTAVKILDLGDAQ